jgi:ABC-type transporter Mla MlaB component
MSESVNLRDDGGGRYALVGAVTLGTVTALRARGLQAFGAGTGAIEVNLGEVARADSGALALLVDWLAWARATGRELHKAAVAKHFRTLADDGARRVLDGSTSLDELIRVIDLTDRM